MTPPPFLGSRNPRELRALAALYANPTPRKQLDRAIGCSNSPDVIFRLRQKGLVVPCQLVSDVDRDGQRIRRGVYHLTHGDRVAIRAWLGTKGSKS